MRLIVGLGNPGPDYAGHRHNVGFMAVDAIAAAHGFPPFRQKFSALIAEGTIAGEKIILAKPQTYMNRSGDSVVQIARFYKLSPAEITVIHDELDLVPGKVRIKVGGGNGGHNGLRSLDAHLTPQYQRVRIGIGHPGHKDRVQPHVLSNFAKADAEWLDPLLDTIARDAALLVKDDAAGLMNRIALAVPSSAEPAPQKPKAQSHIRQARPAAPQAKIPETGPMADMLRKLFGDKG